MTLVAYPCLRGATAEALRAATRFLSTLLNRTR